MGSDPDALEPCSLGSKIDFDTAYLLHRQSSAIHRIWLEARCAVCHWKILVSRWLSWIDVVVPKSNSYCAWGNCKQAPIQGLAGCKVHIGHIGLANNKKTQLTQKMRQVFESSIMQQWTHRPEQDYEFVQQRIQDIREEKLPASSVIILDIEYSISTKELWEVAIIEAVSGETLLNTTIKRMNPIVYKGGTFPGMKHINQAHAQRVFAKSRSNIQHLDVAAAAKLVVQTGINLFL